MSMIQVDFLSGCLMRNVTFNAIIPVDKLFFTGMSARGHRPFKTLYLLHGMLGNHNDWLTSTRIRSWAEERNLAVIMPTGDNRFYVDDETLGDRYGELIGRELVQITRDLFPLSDKREDTYIAGLSMGGYGALRNALKYNETFGYAAGLSSALITETILNPDDNLFLPYPKRDRYFTAIFGDLNALKGSDKDPKTLAENLVNNHSLKPELYLCCGTEDPFIEHNRDYHRFLDNTGYKHTYVEGSGGHNWIYWDESILKILEWLPLEDKTKGLNSGNVV